MYCFKPIFHVRFKIKNKADRTAKGYKFICSVIFIYSFISSFKIHDEEEVGDKIGLTLLDKVDNALDVGVDVYPL